MWARHSRKLFRQLCDPGSRSFASLVGFGTVMGLLVVDTHNNSKVLRCHDEACGCRGRRKELESFLRKADQPIDFANLPVYTSKQVAEKNGVTCDTIWMSYGGFVYDVTRFIPVHPGGTDRICRAAGAAMEPYWYLHTQHFQTEEPLQILSQLIVGRLADEDQEKIDEQVEKLQNKLDSFRLECRTRYGWVYKFSLADLQNLNKTDRVSRIGCASKGGPVQNSLFGGVLLRDLMANIGVKNISERNFVFHAMDGEVVRLERSSGSDVEGILIAYEENGAPLSQRRGFPLRVIIPEKRIIKWVKKIEIQ